MAQYRLIQTAYSSDRTKRFTSLHYDNYIKSDQRTAADAVGLETIGELHEKGVKRKAISGAHTEENALSDSTELHSGVLNDTKGGH